MMFGPLIWLVLLGLLVAGGVALFRRLGESSGNLGRRMSTPRQILDERFAKGEINREEYEARRKTLGG